MRSAYDREHPEEQLQAVLKCGSPGGGHRHYDQTDLLSIMRYGRSFYKTQLLWQGGNYHDWIVKSASHNMVIVDQGNQGVAEPEKLLFKDGGKFKSAAVQIKAPWTLEEEEELGTVLQRRLISLTEDYIVVADYLKDISENEENRAHIFDWLIHPVGYKRIKAGDKKFLRYEEKFAEKGAGQFITACNWYNYEGPACIQFEQQFKNNGKNKEGVLKLDIHAVWPAKGKIMLGENPVNQEQQGLSEAEKRKTLGIRTEGSETRYLTVIEAYEEEPKVAEIEVIDVDIVKVKLTDGRVQVHEISNFTGKDEDISVEMTER